MKSRASTITLSPGAAFDKKIDPLTGRVFTDTLGNVVASGLAAVVEKVCAVVVFATKAVVDAAIAAGTQAVHTVHLLATDAGTKADIVAAVNAMTGPTNVATLTPTSITTQRSKIWSMDGFPAAITAANGDPTGVVSLALFDGAVKPSLGTSSVAQLIQIVGDAVESSRALAIPAVTGFVMVVVSQNASAIIVAEGGTFTPDVPALAAAIGATEIATITVAANDVPVSATSANFGE